MSKVDTRRRLYERLVQASFWQYGDNSTTLMNISAEINNSEFIGKARVNWKKQIRDINNSWYELEKTKRRR